MTTLVVCPRCGFQWEEDWPAHRQQTVVVEEVCEECAEEYPAGDEAP